MEDFLAQLLYSESNCFVSHWIVGFRRFTNRLMPVIHTHRWHTSLMDTARPTSVLLASGGSGMLFSGADSDTSSGDGSTSASVSSHGSRSPTGFSAGGGSRSNSAIVSLTAWAMIESVF